MVDCHPSKCIHLDKLFNYSWGRSWVLKLHLVISIVYDLNCCVACPAPHKTHVLKAWLIRPSLTWQADGDRSRLCACSFLLSCPVILRCCASFVLSAVHGLSHSQAFPQFPHLPPLRPLCQSCLQYVSSCNWTNPFNGRQRGNHSFEKSRWNLLRIYVTLGILVSPSNEVITICMSQDCFKD